MKRIGIAVLGGILLLSCAPVYIPNAVHSPLFSEKGEIDFSGDIGSNGVDAQFAISPVNHFALMLNGSYMNDTPDDTSYQDYHWHLYGEAGAGYYMRFGSVLRFEAFAGFGMGEAETLDEYTFFETDQSILAKGYYQRAFIQPAIGAVTPIFEGGLALRMCYVHFSRFVANDEEAVIEEEVQEDNVFLEPVLYARIGWKWIKFQIQGGFSYPVSKEIVFAHQPLLLSMGIHFHFDAF